MQTSAPPAVAQSSPAADTLIRVDGLRLRFGERAALDGLSFHVDAGEIVGLLGPNGAGKTTTLSLLATLLRPDAGTVELGGLEVSTHAAQARRILGLVPQTLAVYPTLTAAESVAFFARLVGLRGAAARTAVAEALALVGLEDRRHDIVATFSGGMQRRLNLACGVLHRPRVLLLDEPTVGVDPQSRERIFVAVQEQARRGAAVLYSTHYLEEAERLCDRVVLIDHGRVVTAGAPAALIRAAGHGLRLDLITRGALPAGWLDGLAGVAALAGFTGTDLPPARGATAHVVLDTLATAPRVLERAATLGGEVLEFHLHQPDLQDVFITLTGRDLRD